MENILEEVREQAGLGGPAASLANELLVITEQYHAGELEREEFEYLINDVVKVKASADLAGDEVACRWVIAAATTILRVV